MSIEHNRFGVEFDVLASGTPIQSPEFLNMSSHVLSV